MEEATCREMTRTYLCFFFSQLQKDTFGKLKETEIGILIWNLVEMMLFDGTSTADMNSRNSS